MDIWSRSKLTLNFNYFIGDYKMPITKQFGEIELMVPEQFHSKSPLMINSVLKDIKIFSERVTVAKSTIPIFLQGETGVGKTVLAEIFHINSQRK